MKKFKELFENFMKKDKTNNKKNIENLVVFLILLIITIVAINTIWGNNKEEESEEKNSYKILADVSNSNTSSNNLVSEEYNLKEELKDILSKIEGIGAVDILITYSETSSFTPIYNETHSNSTTEEIDDAGGKRTIESTNINKEVVLEESNGKSMPITEKVVMPKVEGVIVAAEGGRKCKYQNKYHTSSICSDRYI
ncbi:MAG: hypothetical protein ACI4VE_04295 [Clostridia bacterium]